MLNFITKRLQEIAVTFALLSAWRGMKQIFAYVRTQHSKTHPQP